jgi:hypothetical protein
MTAKPTVVRPAVAMKLTMAEIKLQIRSSDEAHDGGNKIANT